MALSEMDDATRIVRVLEEKLAELDNKVAAYRAGMAAEFHRYQHDLLRSASEEVSVSVELAIVDSISKFPALGPNFVAESPVTMRQMRPTKGSPPPSVAADNDLDDATGATATPDLLQEDDQEPMRGVFTPSYLPLLEQVQPRAPTIKTSSPTDDARRRGSGGSGVDSVGGGGSNSGSLAPPSPESQAPVRPTSIRRATDDTTSSATSDRSDSSKSRRSALRRSSNASKASSPRRVRFDFDGGEVLPTTSPLAPESEVGGGSVGARSPLSQVPPDFPSAHSLLSDGEDDDAPPPPKKVSSSQALRALSKVPLDMGTVWTVVNGQTDDDVQTPLTPARTMPPSYLASSSLPTAISTDSVRSMDTVRAYSATSSTDTLRRAGSSGSVPEPGAPVPNDYQEEHDDDESSSDGEFLSMGRARRGPVRGGIGKSLLSITPSKAGLSTTKASSSAALAFTTSTSSSSEDETADDVMFDFDDTPGHGSRLKRTVRPAPIEDIAEEDDAVSNDDGAAELATVISMDPSIARSLPRSIGAPGMPSSASTVAAPLTAASTATPTAAAVAASDGQQTATATASDSLQPATTIVPLPSPPRPRSPPPMGNVGSYKGRPFGMPIVLNREVYKQAQSFGDMRTFVGSVDGRSGVDNDYVGSLVGALEGANVGTTSAGSVGTSFSGAPRSLTERMMLDDIVAMREQAEARKRG